MKKLVRITSAIGLCLSVVVAMPSPAQAQDDETATSIARERFKEGVQHFDQKQYDKARVAFLQAYALKRHPAVLLNLAQSELRSGHEAEAAKHFSMYLREAKDATPAEREGAEAGLFAAKAVVGEVAVTVDVEGATVYVDGQEEGLTPLPDAVYLVPGNHQIEVRKESSARKQSVVASAGEATELSFRLAGGVSAQQPGAEKSAPDEAAPPPSHDTSIPRHRGRQPFFSWVGETPLAWVGGGLVVLGIAGGAGFSFSSKQSYDDADAVAGDIRVAAEEDTIPTAGICSDPVAAVNSPAYSNTRVSPAQRATEYQNACNLYQDNVDDGDTMKTLSIVGWAVAGVAAVGTVVYYFADSDDGSSESASAKRYAPRVSASLGATQGFVSLQAQF